MVSSGGIEGLVEAISEAVVFVEPEDLNGLADLHGHLEALEPLAADLGYERMVLAARSARTVLERIILQESEKPVEEIECISKAASSFQQIIRGSLTDATVEYPAALSVPPPAPSIQAQNTSLEQSSPLRIAPRSFTIELPSYVDDAIFAEFLQRQDSVLEEVESALLRLEQGASTEAMGVLTRHLHTLKGEMALLGLSELERLCHAAEGVLESSPAQGALDGLFQFKDWLKRTFDSFSSKSPPPVESIEQMLERLESSGEVVSPAVPEDSFFTMDDEENDPNADEFDLKSVEELPATESRELTGDRELIADFIAEATEHLDRCDVELLTMETDPCNQTAIDSLFRAFHTIKGVCGFIDLSEMQSIAHESENLLDQARKGSILLDGSRLEVIFDAVDMLKALLKHVRYALEHDKPLASEPGLPSLIEEIRCLTLGHAPAPRDVDSAVQALAANIGKAGATPRLGDILVQQGAATRESIEQALQNANFTTEMVDPNQPSMPPPRLGEVLVRHTGTPAREVARALRVQKLVAGPEPAISSPQMETRASTRAPSVIAAQEPVSAPSRLAGQDTNVGNRPSESGDGNGTVLRETVKVDAVRLDQLVDMIGELVIAESMVCQSPGLLKNATTELTRYVSQLDKITRELQEMAMGLRMVPVRSTFQKMARLVRDLAKKTGKEVNFVTHGEDTELDKTVVDRISDPLVHMIRNSVDHGLEADGASRRAAGKPTAGTVKLRAFHQGGSIHIEISDDGKGLDREAILAKARERGLIADGGESLQDKEVWKLIFEPGFSTAKQLTEISGRGVGMDVVKRNIDELRGEIDIRSNAGHGSCFTIRLPLTLAIIDGMVIRAGSERFIIPTLSIIVSVRPKTTDLGTVLGEAETMNLQGEIIPLFRLYELFQLHNAIQDPTEGTVVVLENAGRRVGLLVDRILGQQQIVIKSLGESLRGTRGIAGGAILPDGRVGLIIDVGELVRLATESVPV